MYHLHHQTLTSVYLFSFHLCLYIDCWHIPVGVLTLFLHISLFAWVTGASSAVAASWPDTIVGDAIFSICCIAPLLVLLLLFMLLLTIPLLLCPLLTTWFLFVTEVTDAASVIEAAINVPVESNTKCVNNVTSAEDVQVSAQVNVSSASLLLLLLFCYFPLLQLE